MCFRPLGFRIFVGGALMPYGFRSASDSGAFFGIEVSGLPGLERASAYYRRFFSRVLVANCLAYAHSA